MKLLVDLHSVDDNDVIWAATSSLEPLGLPLGRGTRLTLDDGEGHELQGTVLSVEPGLAELLVDWSTWLDRTVLGTMITRFRVASAFRPVMEEQQDRTGVYAKAG